MNELEQLAIKYGTDKQAQNGHGYTEIYFNLFENLKNDKLNILELGVREGWSINMWVEYFNNSEIWCIDNNFENKCPNSFNNSRIHFHLMDQDDEKKLKHLHEQAGDFDIIIDDCSHISHLTIKSFEILYPLLKKGGLYIIEDLHTCDFPSYTPHGPTTIEYIKSSNLNYHFFGKICAIYK